MGLLDDAIREHLELKRKRGADPGEVDRQVEEALGPPQRAEFADVSEPPEPPLDDGDRVAAVAAPADDAAPAPEREPFDVENLEEAAPVADPDPGPGPEAAAWLDDEEPDEVPAEESLAREPEPERGAGESLAREPEPEGGSEESLAREPEPEGGAEDVLQDTPDFLQETPEHDRLWFEQRPPRDFDWDK